MATWWAPSAGSMVTIAVNKHSDWSGAGLESGCCARGWRQTVGGGVGAWGEGSMESIWRAFPVARMKGEPDARFSPCLFFARRHADWLICSLAHLVNWHVSHFKSYVHNDASCVACYTRLGGSERERRRSKPSTRVRKTLKNDTDRDTDRQICDLYILPHL